MKLKRLINKIAAEFNSLKQKNSDTYYLSLGENCLTDNILDRYKIKSFSTPYSHGRSNIDYAINLEKENYNDLLKNEYLFYDYVEESKVVRNKHYSISDDIYSELHLNGFEFTHHDVIGNTKHRKSYERKITRMKTFNDSKKLKFIYHYRNNKNQQISSIVKKASEFLSYYEKRKITCEFIFFTQEIVADKSERSIQQVHNANNVTGYVLKTLEVWEGDDQEILWAKKDDDLLAKMISDIK